MRCFLSLVVLLTGGWACSGSSEADLEPAELRAAVASGSPAITAWASELLAGTDVAVDPIYAAKGSAGTTTPPRERLRAARDAKLVVLQGAGFAKWARQAALPSSRTVRLIERDAPGVLMVEERTHAHGAQGEHTHRGADGHTWLSPGLAMMQIQELGRQLAAAFPDQRDGVLERARLLADAQMVGLAELRAAVGEQGPPRGLGLHGHGYGYLVEAWGGSYAEVEFPLDQRLSRADWNRLRAQISGAGAVLLVPTAPAPELELQLREEMRVVCVVASSGAEAADPSVWMAARAQTLVDLAAAFPALSELAE